MKLKVLYFQVGENLTTEPRKKQMDENGKEKDDQLFAQAGKLSIWLIYVVGCKVAMEHSGWKATHTYCPSSFGVADASHTMQPHRQLSGSKG